MIPVKTIQLLIAEDRIEEALQRLLQCLGHWCAQRERKLVLLARRLAVVKRELAFGTMSWEEARNERAAGAYELLVLVEGD